MRAGRPNQDALSEIPEAGERVMLAISDGHGSPKYFRSDAGSKFAASVAMTIMRPFLTETSRTLSKHSAEEQLPQKLVRAWIRAVEKDIDAYPFTPEEEKRLTEQEGPDAWERLKKQPLRAYGATLLAVIVTDLFIIYLKLGDGDILTVSEDNQVSRPLFSKEMQLIADETASLCSPDAWNDVQVYFQPLSDANKAPALIILCTDGYVNSFRNTTDFLKAGSDFLAIICAEGLDYVRTHLDQWLYETTQQGSGDDMTVGLLCHTNAIERIKTSLTPFHLVEGGVSSFSITRKRSTLPLTTSQENQRE